MRDYLVRNSRTGTIKPVSKVTTSGLHRILEQAVTTRRPPTLNPGITVDNFIERLKLELFIRELGLRD